MSVMDTISRACRAGIRVVGCFASDPRMLLQAIGWRLLLPFLKAVVPLPTLVRLVSARSSARSGTDGTHPSRLESIGRLLEAGRLVLSGNCLERSLLVYRFLTEAGARPDLVMGVSTSAARVTGHTWVELDGRPVHDSATERFSPILTFGPDGRVRPIAN